MGGTSISLTQREQSVPVTQGRTIQIADVVQNAVSTGNLGQDVRQGVSLDTSASAIHVNGVGGRSTRYGHGTGQVGIRPDNCSCPRAAGHPIAPNSHKDLIETNPVLTDLKQHMSSDYLLASFVYDPDNSALCLGDGFYEHAGQDEAPPTKKPQTQRA